MREDWADCLLGDVVTIQTGKYDANHAKAKGKYRFYTCALEYLMCDTNRFSGKSIILPGNGANVGEVFFYEGEFDAYQRTYVLNDLKLNAKYIFYHLKGFWKSENLDKQYGTATNYIRMGNFTDYILNFPSLPEQRAIVAKIEELFSDLDKGIADLKKAQAQLKIYRQAVLKKAFEGELTTAWREQQTDLSTADELLKQIREERQKHYEQQIENWKQAVNTWEKNGKDGKKPSKPRKIKEINDKYEKLFDLPDKWSWSKLGKIASEISDGPFGSKLKTSDYVDSGVRVIRLENIGNLLFRDSKKSFVSEEKFQSIKNHSIYPTDIIFSSFIAENISVVSIPKHIQLAINKADCFCVRFNNLVYYKFFEFFLSTRLTYSQLANEVHGATRPRINTTQLKEVLIPICSKEEQRHIVQEIESRLSVCDKVEQSINESLEKAKALRQSILKKAFEGKLLSEEEIAKCKQAADYEPASVLLQKIKAEKKKV